MPRRRQHFAPGHADWAHLPMPRAWQWRKLGHGQAELSAAVSAQLVEKLMQATVGPRRYRRADKFSEMMPACARAASLGPHTDSVLVEIGYDAQRSPNSERKNVDIQSSGSIVPIPKERSHGRAG